MKGTTREPWGKTTNKVTIWQPNTPIPSPNPLSTSYEPYIAIQIVNPRANMINPKAPDPKASAATLRILKPDLLGLRWPLN